MQPTSETYSREILLPTERKAATIVTSLENQVCIGLLRTFVPCLAFSSSCSSPPHLQNLTLKRALCLKIDIDSAHA